MMNFSRATRVLTAPGKERGYTFIELIIVTTILMILASAVLPLAQVTSQRQKEAELRRSRSNLQ